MFKHAYGLLKMSSIASLVKKKEKYDNKKTLERKVGKYWLK